MSKLLGWDDTIVALATAQSTDMAREKSKEAAQLVKPVK